MVPFICVSFPPYCFCPVVIITMIVTRSIPFLIPSLTCYLNLLCCFLLSLSLIFIIILCSDMAANSQLNHFHLYPTLVPWPWCHQLFTLQNLTRVLFFSSHPALYISIIIAFYYCKLFFISAQLIFLCSQNLYFVFPLFLYWGLYGSIQFLNLTFFFFKHPSFQNFAFKLN